MLEGIGSRDLTQTLARPIPERSAAGGKHDPSDLRGGVTGEALGHGGVLAIDGKDAGPRSAGRGHDKLSCKHEDLLGGEGEVFARREGREGRFQADRADNGHENDVGLGQCRQGNQPILAPVHVRSGRENGVAASVVRGGFVEQGDVRYVEPRGDAGEAGPVGSSGDAHEFEPVGVCGNDPQGAFADRSGRSEKNDAPACWGRRGGHGKGNGALRV